MLARYRGLSRVSLLLVLLAGLVPLRCGDSGGQDAPDFKILEDLIDDKPNLPEVPNHIFDLVEETLPDGTEDNTIPDVLQDGEVTAPPDSKDTKVQEVGPDGECLPQCTLDDGAPAECGPDGCGSICGYCDYGEVCVDGACKPFCEPQCTLPDGVTPKQCGPDGCYGECPPGCEENFVCGDDGLCYPFCDRDANCAGKECGSDGCGGSCGECGKGLLCDPEAGKCNPHPCGDIAPDKTKCTGDNMLVECIDDALVETACQAMGDDYYCKWDGPAQKFVCSQGCVPICVFPDDTPKECGYDGCYGECGKCTPGWTCDAGTCYPEPGAGCGWITQKGHCLDNVLWFCNNDKLYIDDCAANGMNCQFNVGTGSFKCL